MNAVVLCLVILPALLGHVEPAEPVESFRSRSEATDPRDAVVTAELGSEAPHVLHYCAEFYAPLSTHERSEILRILSESPRDLDEPWFIWVHSFPKLGTLSDPRPGGVNRTITLFRAPSVESDAYAAGLAQTIWLPAEEVKAQASIGEPYRYLQMPPRRDDLGARRSVPASRAIPILLPADARAEEVVEYVQCARAKAYDSGYAGLVEEGQVSVRKIMEGKFIVQLGHGSGIMIECEKTPEGIKASERVGGWIAP